MAFQYLQSKERVVESWFNPVLTGATSQGSNILPPGSFNPVSPFIQGPDPSGVIQQPCGDMIEKPAWLDNDDETIIRNGDILSIGTYLINGVPISSWGTNLYGSSEFDKKRMMMNWYYMDALAKYLFPDGIKAFLNKEEATEYNITKLTIIKMVPHTNAIGLNIYIKFFLGEEEVWAKFENLGVDAKPKIICEYLDKFDIESKIKITGKVWNTIANWFKVKTGIYKCIAKEVLVYSELGQLKKITENSIVEVLFSDETKIKLKYADTVYFVKKPTYFWFNWYFQNK